MTKPWSLALFLGLIPFLAICFSVAAWDRVYPMVFGLPFNLFWLLAWTVLTPICLWGAYRAITAGTAASVDKQRDEEPR